jgi:hypothetical protein
MSSRNPRSSIAASRERQPREGVAPGGTLYEELAREVPRLLALAAAAAGKTEPVMIGFGEPDKR